MDKIEFKRKEIKTLERIADSLEGILALLNRVRKEPNIMHSPRLCDVLMVEGFIRGHDGEFNRKELWKKLPEVMHQTHLTYSGYIIIIDYLLNFNKISIDSEGKVGWIYYPEKVERDLEEEELRVIEEGRKRGR